MKCPRSTIRCLISVSLVFSIQTGMYSVRQVLYSGSIMILLQHLALSANDLIVWAARSSTSSPFPLKAVSLCAFPYRTLYQVSQFLLVLHFVYGIHTVIGQKDLPCSSLIWALGRTYELHSDSNLQCQVWIVFLSNSASIMNPIAVYVLLIPTQWECSSQLATKLFLLSPAN